MLNKPLRGIVPPIITPLLGKNELDVIGLENLIRRMIDSGVAGIFVLGTSGEAQSLSTDLKKQMIKETCRIASKRVPVLVGITDTCFQNSLEIAQYAYSCNADALVAAPPYYFPMGQPELISYYNNLADNIPLPLFLYNMPSHVKVYIEPETVLRLSENANIVGLKDSSSNGVYFQKLLFLLHDKKEFTLLCGPEEMTAEVVLMGAHGGVNGGANLFPKLYVDMYNAAIERNYDDLKVLQYKVMCVSTSLYEIGRFSSSYLKGIKTALKIMNICSNDMAIPFDNFKQEEYNLVKIKLNELKQLGIW